MEADMKMYKLIFKVLVCLTLVSVFLTTGCDDPKINNEEPLVETDDINVGLVKREFRAVWVPTVRNLDVPPATSENNFRNMFNGILDTIESYNMNAVIFQISPMLDAWWKSEINPWSQFLTGMQQGNPPRGNTIWDPMEVMLELSNNRGIEFHAWLNPYRVADPYSQMIVNGVTYGLNELDAMPVPELISLLNQAGRLHKDNFAVRNPQAVYRGKKAVVSPADQYGNEYRRLYLDPAYDEVIEHIKATVTELMTNYDLDVIHYDDYFYPYEFTFTNGGFEALEDSWEKKAVPAGYQKNKQDWDRWLRDNNDNFVRAVREVITEHNKKNNKAVQFGISPIGIWARSDVQGGVNLSGSTSFTYTGGVYADTRMWVLEELVDYMVPQIYWGFENTGSPYDAITDWWTGIHKDKNVHLYVGHGTYQYLPNPSPTSAVSAGFNSSSQILRQLEFNRLRKDVKGSVFYTYRNLLQSGGTGANRVLSDSNALVRNYWNTTALIPEMPWLNPDKPSAPLNVKRSKNVISWDDTDNTRYYVVYRISTQTFMSDDAYFVTQDPSKIIAKVWRNEGAARHLFTDTTESPGRYTYYITAVNNAHLESSPSAAAK
jgi:uncharacterized lipoprotein YddW (UPF0748 family)